MKTTVKIMAKNPHYFSQLAHIEVLTTDLEGSVKFFTDLAGMDVTNREENSVYMRCWGDYFHHTLKLTQSDKSGMAALGWRADSPEALNEVVAHLEETGAGIGWVDADKGRGKAYRFKSPDGHIHEVFWDVVWLKETGERASIFADRYASNRRYGINPRRFDHVTYNTTNYAAEKEFWTKLGLKNPDEVRITDEQPPVGGLWTTANLSHDIAIFSDPTIEPNMGALNHVAFNLDSREEVLLACDWVLEKGYKLAMGAPTRHKADEGFFIYVDEPGGNRFEFYACARLIFAPDHGPDVHYLKDNPNDAWGDNSPWGADGNFKKEHRSIKSFDELS